MISKEESGQEDFKHRETQRKKTTIDSFEVNKTIIAMIIMGFSIFTFLISGYRNWFPPNKRSVCEVTNGRQTKFPAL